MSTLPCVISVLLWATVATSDVTAAVAQQGTTRSPATFRAAVYEHIPHMLSNKLAVVSRRTALDVMQKNLAVYQNQSKLAKQQGAEIIVFPEDGIYGMGFSREAIYPFLEKIPDPEVTKWSPCSAPTRFPDTDVQHALSCMAQENGVYVVANMGDRVPCNISTDPKCPPDGHYQYNTAVAYGPDGTLLAKYHKANLFYEAAFNTPEAKVVYFDTPFGRVGMLICFDLLFKDPAVTMVTDHNITNIAFPTAWMDALPLLSANGYHSSFARGLGVNFLSANIHRPDARFHGSGIYTPHGVASFYYNSDLFSPGKLLVSTIDVIPPGQRMKHRQDAANTANTIAIGMKTSKDDEFQAKLFGDMFTFRLLEESSGSLDICHKNVCCSLTYAFADDHQPRQDMFALGAFDGLHTLEGQYYFQICTLVKCAKKDDKLSCGSPTNQSDTKFKSFSLSGSIQTQFVYPQVVLSNGGQLVQTDETAWSFQNNTVTAPGPGLDTPLLSASLFGRYYARDNDTSPGVGETNPPNDPGNGGTGSMTPQCHATLLMGALMGTLNLLI